MMPAAATAFGGRQKMTSLWAYLIRLTSKTPSPRKVTLSMADHLVYDKEPFSKQNAWMETSFL